MKLLHKIVLSTFLFTTAGSAYAIPTMIDFKANADGDQGGTVTTTNLGESGYDPLVYSDASFGTLTITGSAVGDDDTYAYMDEQWRGKSNTPNGGLGVCKNLSGDDCNPGSDDNVTSGESLHFIWDTDILITGIWFNNNHDSDFRLDGNKIHIEDDIYTFLDTDFDASRSSGADIATAVNFYNADFLYGKDIYVSAGSSFDISYVNDQFYISAIQFETVPEPGILALLSIGLIGLVATRRRM